MQTNIRMNVYRCYYVEKPDDNQGLFDIIWLLEAK